MKKILCLVWIASALSATCAMAQQPSYDQPWRPQYHFTPLNNFMNDANGTVFYRGEYHLFYQYNPFGKVWGHMSWGHAVSEDMVHWQNLPVAIYEVPGDYMIFSGSAAVDWNNTSGLCQNPDAVDRSCLIAIYTAAHEKKQAQHIAYSNDQGRTWKEYPGNPVADLNAPDFRDPNVFWYEPQRKWVMVAVLADQRNLLIFDSPDLKHWTKRSSFGPAGDSAGQWECPDLFKLPVENSKEEKWVLIVNRNPGAPAGGTGVRYLIGNFDGNTFTPDDPKASPSWADWGKDFYGTNAWNDIPDSDGRRIWIGWFSNWQYANKEPTELWRGAQSIPRVLTLRRYSDGLRLVQRPVEELERLRNKPFNFENANVEKANKNLAARNANGEVYELEVELRPEQATVIGLRLRWKRDDETLIGFDATKNEVFIDRTHSGETSFSPEFPGRRSAKLEKNSSVKLHIFVDRSSVEIFANDGERVFSERIYPHPGSNNIEFYSNGSGGKIVSFKMWPLKTIWQ
jgi:fructan beta-fructosidase